MADICQIEIHICESFFPLFLIKRKFFFIKGVLNKYEKKCAKIWRIVRNPIGHQKYLKNKENKQLL